MCESPFLWEGLCESRREWCKCPAGIERGHVSLYVGDLKISRRWFPSVRTVCLPTLVCCSGLLPALLFALTIFLFTRKCWGWECSHMVSALGHLQEFRHPNMCSEKSQKPNCSLLTHVTLHKKGSQGKVKELKWKLYTSSALEALDSFLLPYQRVIINFLVTEGAIK